MPAVQDLGLVQIEEDLYKADLALLDRYQGFSAEVLRLSLVGVAVFGFLLQQFDLRAMAPETRWAAGISIGALVLSAALSLAHRYFSSDGMFHHLHLLRVCLLASSKGVEAAAGRFSENDREMRAKQYKRAWAALGVSSAMLAVGVVALAVCLLTVLSDPLPFRKG
ncbi:MAG TPA: hypothetical protein VND93_10795 [Myxococcales bacterium]|nr:hypothetical protein [Myxococcales bacterium]